MEKTSFSFEIDNFWEKVDEIRSPIFLSGSCEWFVRLCLEEINGEDQYLSMYLGVVNPQNLRLGWKRRASFSFILLNQSGKELGRRREISRVFSAYSQSWGRRKELPLKKLKKEGYLENGKLIVKVEIQVHEVVDEGGITGKEIVDVLGFRVLYSQATPMCKLFQKHRDIASNFRPKSQLLKTAYMNLLLGLVETLNKPPHSFTNTELSNARIELTDLAQVGFKLDWLKTKLDELSLERKKANAHVQEHDDEHIKKGKKKKKKDDENNKVELMNMEEMVTSRGWLVRTWNEWKVRLGRAHFGYVKIHKMKFL